MVATRIILVAWGDIRASEDVFNIIACCKRSVQYAVSESYGFGDDMMFYVFGLIESKMVVFSRQIKLVKLEHAVKQLLPSAERNALLMRSVKSAFALLLTKVTKPYCFAVHCKDRWAGFTRKK